MSIYDAPKWSTAIFNMIRIFVGFSTFGFVGAVFWLIGHALLKTGRFLFRICEIISGIQLIYQIEPIVPQHIQDAQNQARSVI